MTLRTVGCTLLCLLLAAAPPAFADKGGKEKEHKEHKEHKENKGKGNPHNQTPAPPVYYAPESRSSVPFASGSSTLTVNLGFLSQQRLAVQSYYRDSYGNGCPPGLAKKNNGCLPPGQAKKRYSVGKPLSSSVRVGSLSPELALRIGPAPSGYRYGVVDGDVVKLAIGSLMVVDAIRALSD